MLTAVDEEGLRFVLQKTHTPDALRELRQKRRFHCEICREPLILKVGDHVTPHFAHKAGLACEGDNEPESASHREGKWALYDWLLQQNERPELEQYFPNIKQRADIAVPHRNWVVEFQCSNITPKRFIERTKGYSKLQLKSIWILGANRLIQKGPNIYKWMQTDYLMLKPDSKKKIPYVLFFDGHTKRFIILSHFWSLSSNLVIANQISATAENFSIDNLFNPTLPAEIHEIKINTWLKQKEKWRRFINPHPHKLERYVQTICSKHHLSFYFFPPYIGLPISNDLSVASPTYLWQAWLVLQFLYDRPKGTILYIKTIEKAFMRLADKKIITLREGNGYPFGAILSYLRALEQFAIIKKSDNGHYTVNKQVRWEQKSISHFAREDAAYLWRWVELEV